MPIKLNSAGGGSVTINAASTASATVLTVPATNANLVTTGDSGTITQTMLGSGLAGNGPSFSVGAAGSTQTISSGIVTKVTNLGITGTSGLYYWDTNSLWDNTNKRFTPNIAGYYLFNATIAIAGVSSGANLGAEILKNGDGKRGSRINNGGVNDAYLNVSCMYYMNGTTDYAELYAFNGTAGNLTVRGESSTVWFSGVLIRSA